MQFPLSKEDIDGIWKTLTLEQQEWIMEYTKQRRRDKWFEALAERKGIILDIHATDEEKRNAIDDWELVEVLDGGKGNKPFKCECGKSIRFQYIVYHVKKDKTYKLGSTCISHYTGLTADVVNDVKKGILQINTKRDELLLKIKNQQFTNLEWYEEKGINVPLFIKKQREIGLPLFDEQIKELEELLEDLMMQRLLEKRIKERDEWERRWKENKTVNAAKQIIIEPNDFQQECRPKEENEYTYDSFIEEHIHILREIRKKEEDLSPKLKEEWDWMQNEVRQFKLKGTMDFEKFKVRMENMMIPLKINK
ncbi:hypothetical protein QA612_20010 [Evansella sp. AB-P1]|uniref:hypothetical protein n=1 Tax=Evansella sp. AB-P1 TaxID=3037653 RepID=UPI00241CFAEB|nr:hypothetical protein [Evansella sp. AB-P1]MDG5789747.1 hypothetical protein [Evansella sp. AB-P1]